MSLLSHDCLAGKGLEATDVATLMELMAKTISSAR
jgi:hypothetical protein